MSSNTAYALELDAPICGLFGFTKGTLTLSLSPFRQALAIWGLTVDGIGALSIHGTSIRSNEKDETRILDDIFNTISKSPGNGVPVVAQKSLLRHCKDGTMVWQAAELLQTINTEVIPENPNSGYHYSYLTTPEICELIDASAGSQTPIVSDVLFSLQALIHSATRPLLCIDLSIIPDSPVKRKSRGIEVMFLAIVEDLDGEVILFHDIVIQYTENEHNVTLTVSMLEPMLSNPPHLCRI